MASAWRAERASTNGQALPPYEPSLAALQPALQGQLPVAFEANESREILRALDMAEEFKLEPMITGGREADKVIPELKARNVNVIYNLNYPTRSRMLPPEAEESIEALRARANAPKVPGALAKAGVPFAFSATGLQQPRDFVRNVARAVREGLSSEAALRALTLDAAKIAGADARVTGTAEAPRVDGHVEIHDGGFQSYRYESLIADVDYAGNRATIDATLTQTPTERITVTGTAPMSLWRTRSSTSSPSAAINSSRTAGSILP